MPTSLTQKIYDGKEFSLREFILRCATQMDAGHMATYNGENNLPLDKAPVIPVEDYHLKSLSKAKDEVRRWLGIEQNPEELDLLYEQYKQNRENENRRFIERTTQLKERYKNARKIVDSWAPPKEYYPLKEVMLKQIDESAKHDCGGSIPNPGDPCDKQKFLELNIVGACEDVVYHSKAYKEDVKRTDEWNKWLKGLYDALDNMEYKIEECYDHGRSEEDY